MDARQLRSFLKILELGSISRAAEALGLAQPSLSQQVLRLEDEAGARLFRRTARGVQVTEAGRIFQEHAHHILRIMDQALEDVRQLKEEPTGVVNFGMPSSVSAVLGVPLVEAVLKHAPSVSLHLVEAQSAHVRSWLDDGTLDLGVLYDAGQPRHLSVIPLAREELFLVGPPERFAPLAEGSQIASRKLGEFPLILPSQQHGLRQFLDRKQQRLGVKLQVNIEIDALAHIRKLVAAGRGFSILSLPVVSEDLEAGRLSVARIERGELRRAVALVRNSDRLVTRASVRIEDLLIKITRQLIRKERWAAELEPSLNPDGVDARQLRIPIQTQHASEL